MVPSQALTELALLLLPIACLFRPQGSQSRPHEKAKGEKGKTAVACLPACPPARLPAGSAGPAEHGYPRPEVRP